LSDIDAQGSQKTTVVIERGEGSPSSIATCAARANAASKRRDEGASDYLVKGKRQEGRGDDSDVVAQAKKAEQVT